MRYERVVTFAVEKEVEERNGIVLMSSRSREREKEREKRIQWQIMEVASNE